MPLEDPTRRGDTTNIEFKSGTKIRIRKRGKEEETAAFRERKLKRE